MLALFTALFGSLCFMLGILFFPIQAGLIGYSVSGTDGLFIIMFALMIIFMGFTPVGPHRNSWLLFLIGFLFVGIGAVACMAPGLLDRPISILLACVLIAKGAIRLPFFFIHKEKIDQRPPRVLEVSYLVMHVLCLVLGILLLMPGFATKTYLFAVLLCLLGIDQVILSVAMNRAGSTADAFLGVASQQGLEQAAEETTTDSSRGEVVSKSTGLSSSVGLSPRQMAMLFMAVIVICIMICGFLGGSGIIVYDYGRSMALFIFCTGVQILLTHDTPIKTFKPSIPLTTLGFAVSILAMLACIIPGAMDTTIGAIAAVSNLLTTVFGFIKTGKIAQKVSQAKQAGRVPPRAMYHLVATSALLYSMCFLFALNILVPGLIPSMLLLAILAFTAFGLIRVTALVSQITKLGFMPA